MTQFHKGRRPAKLLEQLGRFGYPDAYLVQFRDGSQEVFEAKHIRAAEPGSTIGKMFSEMRITLPKA